MNSEQKLDSIISKLDKIENLLSARTHNHLLKEKFRQYMLENFNISWIDDNIEGCVYDTLFDFAFDLIQTAVPKF